MNSAIHWPPMYAGCIFKIFEFLKKGIRLHEKTYFQKLAWFSDSGSNGDELSTLLRLMCFLDLTHQIWITYLF